MESDDDEGGAGPTEGMDAEGEEEEEGEGGPPPAPDGEAEPMDEIASLFS